MISIPIMTWTLISVSITIWTLNSVLVWSWLLVLKIGGFVNRGLDVLVSVGAGMMIVILLVAIINRG